MTPKEIDDFIMQCPYFGGKNIIDRKIIDGELVHIGECDLEWNHLKICPSAQCACARKMGLQEAEQWMN